MPVEVFGISLRTHYRENLSQKLQRLFSALKPEEVVLPKSLWAIKIHFGERGCHTFLRPHLVRAFSDTLKGLSAKPFLTDANTLYVGGRTNAVDHLETALAHGFSYEATGAPLIIGDGLRGGSEVGVPVGRGGVETAWIGSDFMAADGALLLSHVKGHEMTGFGGALKNLGMGAASRRGKMDQHAVVCPKVAGPKCTGCRRCLTQCDHGAITMTSKKKAHIEQEKCVGCAACIPVCPEEAVELRWDSDIPKMVVRMMEYAKAALRGKEGRVFYVNYVGDLSPFCDCTNHSDTPIAPNLGYLASYDPVALDLASAELVNNAQGLPGSSLPAEALAPGADKWEALHPGTNWRYQLEYAAEIGLGSLDYRLIWLEEAKGVVVCRDGD